MNSVPHVEHNSTRLLTSSHNMQESVMSLLLRLVRFLFCGYPPTTSKQTTNKEPILIIGQGDYAFADYGDGLVPLERKTDDAA